MPVPRSGSKWIIRPPRGIVGNLPVYVTLLGGERFGNFGLVVMRDGHLPIATTFKFKFNVHVSLPAYLRVSIDRFRFISDSYRLSPPPKFYPAFPVLNSNQPLPLGRQRDGPPTGHAPAVRFLHRSMPGHGYLCVEASDEPHLHGSANSGRRGHAATRNQVSL